MNEHEEYCPVKRIMCSSLRSPYTWVLTSFVLGVLLMAALGGSKDIEKAMWFATGAAITAVATAYQTYQSSKRAKEEREHTEMQAKEDREFRDKAAERDFASRTRLSSYEYFLNNLALCVQHNFDNDRVYELLIAYSRIAIVSTEPITVLCCKAYKDAIDLNGKRVENILPQTADVITLRADFGKLHDNIIQTMRKDIQGTQ